MGLPAIMGGLGLATSLFGRKNYNQANGYMNQETGEIGQEGALSGQYSSIAGQQLGNYNSDNSSYRNAAQGLGNYLQQNPNTDQFGAAQIAKSTAGMSDAYSRARANLSAGLSNSGMANGSAGGGGSSGLAGGLAGIEDNAAGTMAGAQNNLALSAIAQHRQNLEELPQLYGGMASQDYSNGMGAMGAQGSLDSEMASQYGNLANESIGRTDAYNSGLSQIGGSLLGGAGNLYGFTQMQNMMNRNGGNGGMFMFGGPAGLNMGGAPVTGGMSGLGGLDLSGGGAGGIPGYNFLSPG